MMTANGTRYQAATRHAFARIKFGQSGPDIDAR